MNSFNNKPHYILLCPVITPLYRSDTFLLFVLLTADSLWKYIQSCHNIYCLSLLLFYNSEHKTLTCCSVFITRTNCMECCSVLISMQSSSPTFSTPSTVTVSIFSCKVIKKDNSDICIALLATEKSGKQSKVHNKLQRINQQKNKQKLQLLPYQTWKFSLKKIKYEF